MNRKDNKDADIMNAWQLASIKGSTPVEILETILALDSGEEPEAWREVLGAY